jgi:hypothetical protein
MCVHVLRPLGIVQGAGVFVMRQKAIGPFKGRLDGGNEPLNRDTGALGGSDDLNQDEKRTSW